MQQYNLTYCLLFFSPYFRVICAVLILSCIVGTAYDGFQRLQNNPYDNLKEQDIQDGELLKCENEQDGLAKREDKIIETMRVNFSTKRKHVKWGFKLLCF